MIKFLGDENIFDNLATAFGVVIPVPVEFSTSYGKGTSNGPQAILNASQYVELYDEVFEKEFYQKGILTAPIVNSAKTPQETMKQIENTVQQYIENDKFVIALGGEHSVSKAVFTPFNQKFKGLSILQLDAHADLRYSYEDSVHSHACVMRRIWELNKNIVQCGIRSVSAEEAEFIKKNKIKTYFAHILKKENNWDDVIDQLGDNVYLTIDVDFFDPSIMPSTGTPEPGGFFWDETINFLYNLFSKKNVVGWDLVEFSPISAIHHAEFMAAKLVYKLFAFKFNSMLSGKS